MNLHISHYETLRPFEYIIHLKPQARACTTESQNPKILDPRGNVWMHLCF